MRACRDVGGERVRFSRRSDFKLQGQSISSCLLICEAIPRPGRGRVAQPGQYSSVIGGLSRVVDDVPFAIEEVGLYQLAFRVEDGQVLVMVSRPPVCGGVIGKTPAGENLPIQLECKGELSGAGSAGSSAAVVGYPVSDQKTPRTPNICRLRFLGRRGRTQGQNQQPQCAC